MGQAACCARACQDEEVLDALAHAVLEQPQVLPHRVRRSLEPLLLQRALARRQHLPRGSSNGCLTNPTLLAPPDCTVKQHLPSRSRSKRAAILNPTLTATPDCPGKHLMV